MAMGARRRTRSDYNASHVANAVTFYTGTNYTGSSLTANLPSDNPTVVAAGFNDAIRSVKMKVSAKVYGYGDINYDGPILCLKQSVPDLTPYYDDSFSFLAAFSSYRVRSSQYTSPHANVQVIPLGDGTTIPIWPGSEKFGNVVVDQVITDIQGQATYENFTAIFPAASFQTGLQQLARNICSVMYSDPDQVPRLKRVITLHFMAEAGGAAAGGSHIWIYNGIAADRLMAALVHELTHFFQRGKNYSDSIYAKGTIEGIATYVPFKMGYQTDYIVGGGNNWYDGYHTTARFFDYVQDYAPVPSPGFIRKVIQSMNGTDPAISNTMWDPAVITTLNAQGKTVNQLWTDYKASF